MSTTNHTDATSKFWIENDGGASTETPFEATLECCEEDTRSAFNEARGRAEEAEQLEQARDSIDVMRHGFGSLTAGIEFGDALTKAYRADPIGTREWHRRQYAARFPNPMPEKPKDEQPPDDLDPIGLRNWEGDQATKRAYRDAVSERAFRKELEDAAPAIALLKQNYPGSSLTELLDKGAGVHMAMEANPRVADKLSMTAGAPVNQQHLEEMVAAAQYQQRTASLDQWLGAVEQSGQLPGLERPAVQDATVQVLEAMNANGLRTNSVEQDLVTAYSYAVAGLQEQLQSELQRERAVEHAGKARHASKSITGSPGSDVGETDVGGGSIEDDARGAYRSVMATTRV